MTEGRHLLVQAGTGTGKSLGYLVPAMLHDKRVVVATATLALQHQLVERDLPRLVEAVKDVPRHRHVVRRAQGPLQLRLPAPHPRRRARRPGRPRRRAHRVDGREGPRAARRGPRRRPRHGGSGERDNAPRHTDREWRQVSVNHRECLGASKCPFGAECFAELAKEKAQRSHLIVTNHSLLAIDAIEDVPMIPDYDTVVIDEAHELVQRVTQAATDELGVSDIERAARRAGRWTDGDGDPAGDLEDAAGAAGGGDRGDAARAHRPDVRSSSPTRWCWCATRPAPACRPSRASRGGEAEGDAGRTQAKGMVQEVFVNAERMAAGSQADVLWLGEAPRPLPGPRSTSRRCRCGARCATSCSPTRRWCSPARR